MARSPNYPAESLPQAIALTGDLYSKFDRREFTELEAVQALGYNSLNGASRRKLAALKHYDLVQDRDKGVVAVSRRWLDISRPEDDVALVQAAEEALRQPAMFRQILDHYGDTLSPGRLMSVLVREHGFVDSAAKIFEEVFSESVAYVKDLKTRLPEADVRPAKAPADEVNVPMDAAPERGKDKPAGSVMEYKMNLSRDVVAHLTIAGEIADTDLWLLRAFLSNAQMAVLNAVVRSAPDGVDVKDLKEKLLDDLKR
jgi:hypothetical protein